MHPERPVHNEGSPLETVKEIYRTPLTKEEKNVISTTKDEIINESDIGGVQLYEELRSSLQELDTDEGWKSVKEEARKELTQLPDSILETLLKRFSPYIKNLPAGHSKGHLFRDAIHLTGMFQDPSLQVQKIDEVELFTGIMAGMFHDIGNSIVNRYDDAKRLGAHAEVGSVLFGKIVGDILPPQLTKLSQYAIAAHTHYPSSQDVTLPNGEIVNRKGYNDGVTPEGDRLSMWLTRQTDRRDTTNIAFLFRNYILRTKPIQDFDGISFDELKEQEKNFRIQFGTEPEYVNQKGIISHTVNFAKNVFNCDVPYTTHDSPHFTRNLMTPGLSDIALFLDVVAPEKKDEMLQGIEKNEKAAMNNGKWPVQEGEKTSSELILQTIKSNQEMINQLKSDRLSPAMIEGAVERFIQLAEVVEPAEDLSDLTTSLRLQFLGGESEVEGEKRIIGSLLSPQSQETLARGFLLLTDTLFEKWRERLENEIKLDPQLGEKVNTVDTRTQQILTQLGSHLHDIAQFELSEINFPERKTS